MSIMGRGCGDGTQCGTTKKYRDLLTGVIFGALNHSFIGGGEYAG